MMHLWWSSRSRMFSDAEERREEWTTVREGEMHVQLIGSHSGQARVGGCPRVTLHINTRVQVLKDR